MDERSASECPVPRAGSQTKQVRNCLDPNSSDRKQLFPRTTTTNNQNVRGLKNENRHRKQQCALTDVISGGVPFEDGKRMF